MTPPLRFMSVCAGIGGFDLGLEAAGMTCVAQIEIDDYATKVLEKHWPDVPRFRDLRRTSARMLPSCDVLAGGIPCQPHSLAGKRGAGSDTRDLWPDFFRLICEIRPAYAVVENVAGLRSSDRGRFFGRILSDLAALGYCTEWISLSAADVGAPHQRERVWLVAYPEQSRYQRQIIGDETHRPYTQRSASGISRSSDGSGAADVVNADRQRQLQSQGTKQRQRGWISDSSQNVSNADSQRWRWREQQQEPVTQCGGAAIAVPDGGAERMANANSAGCQKQHASSQSDGTRHNPWCVASATHDGPTQPRLGRTAHGPASGVHGAWADGWEDGTPRVASGVKHRNSRLKCLGNAIVPQCAAIIGAYIVQHWDALHDEP